MQGHKSISSPKVLAFEDIRRGSRMMGFRVWFCFDAHLLNPSCCSTFLRLLQPRDTISEMLGQEEAAWCPSSTAIVGTEEQELIGCTGPHVWLTGDRGNPCSLLKFPSGVKKQVNLFFRPTEKVSGGEQEHLGTNNSIRVVDAGSPLSTAHVFPASCGSRSSTNLFQPLKSGGPSTN